MEFTSGGSQPDPGEFSYSIVIPVFNSEEVVGTTVDQVLSVFTDRALRHEVILVNDGSRDRSWDVIAEKARTTSNVIALDMLRNYGQHHANLAGLRESTGDFVITMDDDLQNPPDQALLLIDEAMTGKDVVFGRFDRKQATLYRRLGSRLIRMLNRRIFGQPEWLEVSNYRVLRRDVVDRICATRTAHPYITGQALLYCRNPSHVTVRHDPRPVGESNYSVIRILRLVLTILFSYSLFPLRLAAAVGFAISALSMLLGAFYLTRGLLGDSDVEGWTTLVVLLAIFNGFTIALLCILGEYVIRTLNAVSSDESYHVTTRVSQ